MKSVSNNQDYFVKYSGSSIQKNLPVLALIIEKIYNSLPEIE